MLYLTFPEDEYVHVQYAYESQAKRNQFTCSELKIQSTHGDFHNFVKLSATMCDESVCCTTGVDW